MLEVVDSERGEQARVPSGWHTLCIPNAPLAHAAVVVGLLCLHAAVTPHARWPSHPRSRSLGRAGRRVLGLLLSATGFVLLGIPLRGGGAYSVPSQSGVMYSVSMEGLQMVSSMVPLDGFEAWYETPWLLSRFGGLLSWALIFEVRARFRYLAPLEVT